MAKMIDVTVKTLDSQNHLFTVSEELTVKEFKQEILPQVGIPVDQQRLIFRGRVLQDDKKIAEYNVASNTVHLVQRPIQPPGAPRNDEPQRNTTQQEMNFDGGAGGGIIITAGAGPSDRNAIIMGTIGEAGNQGGGIPRRNSAAVRLQVGNEMLNRASNILQRLEEEDEIAAAAGSVSNDMSPSSARDSGSASPTPMEVESEGQDSFRRMIAQVAHAALVASIREAQPQAGNTSGSDPPPTGSTPAAAGATSSNTSVGSAASGSDINSNSDNTSNRTAARRPEAPRLRELAIAVQDLLAIQERLTPFLNYVQHILRENMAYDNTSELQSIQYVFDSVSSILHLVGHSYHAYSDLMCDFAIPPETRRLRATSSILVEQSTVVRATIPLAVPMGGAANWGFLQPNFGGGNGTTTTPPQPQQPGGTATPATVPNNADTPEAAPAAAAAAAAAAAQAAQAQGILHGLGNHPIMLGNHAGNLGNHPGVSINIQANAGIPDFASLLGPAMGMGVGMPAALQPFLNNIQSNIQRGNGGGGGGAAGNGWPTANQDQTAAQQASQQTLQNLFGLNPTVVTPPPPPPATTATPNASNAATEPNSGNTAAAAASTPTPAPAPTANANNNNGGNGNNIFGNLQRNDLMRPPFDLLLSCHSHHNSRSRQRSRPNDLHRYVNVASSGSEGNPPLPSRTTDQSVAPDFFESLIDYFRCSNVLMETQPMLKDWIQGYLMRGRDIKNIQHVRTCSRSMAKKLLPFFQSFTDRIPNKNEDVIYPDTYSNVVTNFYTTMIQHVLQSGPTAEYRSGMLSIVEEFLMSLFSIFAISFPDNSHVPEVFANCILDEYFGGMSLVFRAYSKHVLMQYFSALSRAESANEPVANSPIVYRRPESEFQDAVNDSDGSFKSASGSDCAISSDIPQPAAKEDPRPDVPDNKLPPPTFVDADMDDDDVLDDLTLPPPPLRTPMGAGGDSILRHLPNEWADTVRLDMRRQLGMPEQPPFSQGFCTLFPRKH